MDGAVMLVHVALLAEAAATHAARVGLVGVANARMGGDGGRAGGSEAALGARYRSCRR